MGGSDGGGGDGAQIEDFSELGNYQGSGDPQIG